MINTDIAHSSRLMADAQDTAQTLSPLKCMRKPFLEDLFKHSAVQTVFAGQVIFENGAFDYQHIYLLHGDVELVYPNGHTELVKGRDQASALAHQQPRPCRAIAKKDCSILRIDSDRLDRTLSWSQIADFLMSEISMQRDLDEDVEWMQTVLNSNLFFKVPPVNATHIFGRLTPMVVLADEVLIRQGQIGDCCYFIKEGRADILVRHDDKEMPEKVAEVGPGRCIGEDALVNETVRNATVKMKTDGVLMRLEKSDFLLLLKEPMVEELDENEMAELPDKPVLVDVRSDEEYSAGHLAFSANIPLSLLSLKKRLLSSGKNYVFYCDTGRRSRAAAWLLGKEGYSVFALRDGFVGAGMADNLVQETGYILRDGELLSGQ